MEINLKEEAEENDPVLCSRKRNQKKVFKRSDLFCNRIGFLDINLNTFITLAFGGCQEG
jgi:hypothetical protein